MRAFLCLALAGCLFSTITLFAADDKPTTKVEGTFVIPKEVPSFTGRVVEIRLYQHDPRIADKAADLIEKVEIKDFSHTKDKETKKEFSLGAKGTLDSKMGYYVTLFVLEKDKRTHIGECEHSKKDLCKVLTNNNPRKISLTIREVK